MSRAVLLLHSACEQRHSAHLSTQIVWTAGAAVKHCFSKCYTFLESLVPAKGLWLTGLQDCKCYPAPLERRCASQLEGPHSGREKGDKSASATPSPFIPHNLSDLSMGPSSQIFPYHVLNLPLVSSRNCKQILSREVAGWKKRKSLSPAKMLKVWVLSSFILPPRSESALGGWRVSLH